MVGPGVVAFFGSGETAPSGRRVHEALFRRLTPPVRAVILETPAGFELNSAYVAERIAALGYRVVDTPEGPRWERLAAMG